MQQVSAAVVSESCGSKPLVSTLKDFGAPNFRKPPHLFPNKKLFNKFGYSQGLAKTWGAETQTSYPQDAQEA